MRVHVIGGGPAGYAASLLLNRFPGKDITLVSGKPSPGEVALLDPDGERLTSADIPTLPLGDIKDPADLTLICTPVHAYMDILRQIKATVTPTDRKLHIGVLYGQGFFNLMCKEVGIKEVLPNVEIFQIGFIPWVVKKVSDNQVKMTGRENWNLFHSTGTDSILTDVLDDLLAGPSKWEEASTFFEVSMASDNMYIHPPRLVELGIMRELAYRDIPYFYRDYKALARGLFKELQEEMIPLMDQIDLPLFLPYKSLEERNGNPGFDIKDYVVSPLLRDIKVPTVPYKEGWSVIDTNSRFFKDDLDFGLELIRDLFPLFLPRAKTPYLDGMISVLRAMRPGRPPRQFTLTSFTKEEVLT